MDLLVSNAAVGCAFVTSGIFVFMCWWEELYQYAEGPERRRFLLHEFSGGLWVLSLVLICAGLYFLALSFLRTF